MRELGYKVKLNFESKKKKLKNDFLLEESRRIQESVEAFYNKEDISKWTPGKQEVISVKDSSTGKKVYLQLTLLELYAVFKAENPDIKIGKSKFCSLRPKNVLLSSETPHNICLCTYHENIIMILEALHKYSQKMIPLYSSSFRDQMVCENATTSCWFNQCEICKNSTLFKCIYPFANIDLNLIPKMKPLQNPLQNRMK